MRSTAVAMRHVFRARISHSAMLYTYRLPGAPRLHGASRVVRQAPRTLCSEVEPSPIPPAKSSLDRTIEELNECLEKYPNESMCSWVVVELGIVGAIYAALGMSGVSFSGDFAIAFALSRPIKRVRLPLNLAAAAVLSRLCPPLTRINLLAIMGMSPGEKGGGKEGAEAQGSSFGGKTWDRLMSAINKYGAAYYFGSRAMGVTVIFGLYYKFLSIDNIKALRLGMDASWMFEKFGISQQLGDALGTWAASVTIAAFFAPANLVIAPHLAKRLAQLPIFKNLRNSRR